MALRRPYTFVVLSLLILILGVPSVYRTRVDIFPVVSVTWTYNGMGPEEMTKMMCRLTFGNPRNLSAPLTIQVNLANHR